MPPLLGATPQSWDKPSGTPLTGEKLMLPSRGKMSQGCILVFPSVLLRHKVVWAPSLYQIDGRWVWSCVPFSKTQHCSLGKTAFISRKQNNYICTLSILQSEEPTHCLGMPGL